MSVRKKSGGRAEIRSVAYPTRSQIACIFACILIFFCPEITDAQQSPPRVYVGPVQIDTLQGDIWLKDGRLPRVKLDISLINQGRSDTGPLEFSFIGGSHPTIRSISSRDSTVLHIDTESSPPSGPIPSSDHSGRTGDRQRVRIPFLLQVDGNIILRQIRTLRLTIHLPSGAVSLLRSNEDLVESVAQGDRVYELVGDRRFLTELVLDYDTGSPLVSRDIVGLRITKTITPLPVSQPQTLQVSITVENLTNVRLDRIRLSDLYDPRDFVPGPSSAGFNPVRGTGGDARFEWTRTIRFINTRGSTTITYNVETTRALNGYRLPGTLAFISDASSSRERLVGMSNDIWLPPY